LSENLDDVTISKWSYPGATGLAFTSKKLEGKSSWRQAVPLYGDMFGDWREEVLLENTAGTAIRIYTTTIVTDKRIYTLMHDPEYRNSMNEKGYQQSHMVDYYLGDGMTDPPRPNIKYPDGSGAAGAGGGGTTGAAGAGGGGTTGAAGASGGGTTGAAGQAGGGTTGTVDTSVAPTGGTAATEVGGTSGAEGGTLATGGNTVASTTAPIPTAGTSAVVPPTGGSTNNGGGGAVAGQGATGPTTAAAASGCSCAIGATSGRASAGYLVAMLSMLGLALNRRRRRTGFRD
jgi:MYXO-CTERM domain-containing protein